MKQFLRCTFAGFLCLVLLCTSLPLASAADVGTYVVTAGQTPMLSQAGEEGSFICNVYKGTVVEVTEVRLGYGYVYRKSVSVGGWIRMEDLRSVNTDFAEDNIVGIEISLPDKLTYIIGEEEFDKTGLTVWAVYANNDKIEVTDYTLYKPALDTLGAKNITVWYRTFGSGRSFTATFTVSVEKVPVKSISVEGTPKTQFIEGQTVSFDGIAVRVQYLDGRADRVFSWEEIRENPDFTFTVDNRAPDGQVLALGEHTVCVSYLYPEHTATYTVEAVERQPARLEVLQQPYKDYFYSDTRKPELNGLVLSLVYNNDTRETVSHRDVQLVFDPETAVMGDNAVTVRYMGVEALLTMRMIEPSLVGIEIADPGKTVYIQGAVFDGTDTVINGIYDSGSRAELSNWEVHSFDTQTCGVKTVEIRHGEFSAYFTVYVTLSGYLNGDADLDGKITATDARAILRHSAGLEALSGTALFAADRDGNGAIGAGDARLTLRAAVGLEPIIAESNE